MFTTAIGRIVDKLDCCPWGGVVGHSAASRITIQQTRKTQLYTPEQRARRDASPWTTVQGVLAPAQFAVFLVSFGLVARFLLTGEGEAVAIASVVLKTATLYLIMVTGSVWERAVFGRYLFVPAFYWEDMVSMVVLALHTAYIAALFTGALGSHQLMLLALAGLRDLRGERRAIRAEAARMARKEQPIWAAGARA